MHPYVHVYWNFGLAFRNFYQTLTISGVSSLSEKVNVLLHVLLYIVGCTNFVSDEIQSSNFMTSKKLNYGAYNYMLRGFAILLRKIKLLFLVVGLHCKVL